MLCRLIIRSICFNIYENDTLPDFIHSDNSNLSSGCIKSRKCSSIGNICDGNVIVLLLCIFIGSVLNGFISSSSFTSSYVIDDISDISCSLFSSSSVISRSIVLTSSFSVSSSSSSLYISFGFGLLFLFLMFYFICFCCWFTL